MIIPRENKFVRLYIQVTEVDEHGKAVCKSQDSKFLTAAADTPADRPLQDRPGNFAPGSEQDPRSIQDVLQALPLVDCISHWTESRV